MFNQSLHECPIEGCPVMCSANLLLCAGHWFMVPMGLRTTINRLWERNQGQSAEYIKARQDAVSLVNKRVQDAAKEQTHAKRG